MCVAALSRVNNEGTPQSAIEDPGWSLRIIVITRRYDLWNRAWYPHCFPFLSVRTGYRSKVNIVLCLRITLCHWVTVRRNAGAAAAIGVEFTST